MLNHSSLSEHDEIPIRPLPCVNPTLFIVLISELLIKTRACLSRVSCGFMDSFSFCRGFVQALIGADLQPHVKEETERRGRGLSSPWYIECITSFTAAQTLIYRQSRLTSYYWMNSRCTLTLYAVWWMVV